MGHNINLSVVYLQMFSTYKDTLYKYLNIKVYYRLNVF